MCWQALPLILSAAGSAVQRNANDQALKAQERIAAEGILKQAAANREADTAVAQNVRALAASTPEEDVAKRRAAYTDALRRSLGSRAGALPTSGNVSARFASDAENAATQTEENAAGLADLTAAIDAPTYQREREAHTANDTAVNLNLIRGRAQGQDYLTRLRMAMQKPNAGQMAAGQLLSGFGNAAAANGGFGADAATADAYGMPIVKPKAYGSIKNARIPAADLNGELA